MTGLPAVREVEATSAALNSLLDALDGRFGRQQHPQHRQAEQLIAPQPVGPRESELNSDDDGNPDDLAIEDSVIRELARSLRPRH
jgi:hypothetical protein